ncbi:transcriptional regulator [Enterobacter ludwigii]|jgi:DNA-binding winged helix-turn-helix (wHTH) protein|uniref:winged helix-turn-helix domain-containing protein n=1 Tax=Enterobacter ludwigii TaxID=299767 RepID=UPI002072F2F3
MHDEGAAHHEILDYFKINGLINFYPDGYLLENSISGETVTLLSTAAECFKILIEEQGRVVTRKEMKEQVWGKRGVVVSSNTFYQNMLNLRRGLEKVGAGTDLITTHYGKGVAIGDEVHITRVRYENPDTVFTENVSSKDNDEIIKVGTEISGESSAILKRKKTVFKLHTVNISMFVLCMSMLFMNVMLKRDNYFSQYTETPYRVKNCSIYADLTQTDEHELQAFLKHNTPECEEGETLYLSSIYPVPRMSVIRCTGSFLPGDECESDYYLE